VTDVFGALADPNRRHLLQALAREEATATELAAGLPVTRQAVAKHLAALREAGLVDARRLGRETRYRLTPEPLGEAVEWLTSVGGAWDERLAALRRHLGQHPARGS
jgi:DNA-binding transcriptional ArsR family regulator